MKAFTRNERILLAAAPVCAPLSLLVGQLHGLGTPDTLDAVRGVVMGIGIGMALTALIKHRLGRGC